MSTARLLETPERVGMPPYLPSAAAMSFAYSRTLFRCAAFIGANVDINSKKNSSPLDGVSL